MLIVYVRMQPGIILLVFCRLQVIDPNYRSYFRTEVEDDGEDSTRSRKRKKNDRVLGAPEEDDREYARYYCYGITYISFYSNMVYK